MTAGKTASLTLLAIVVSLSLLVGTLALVVFSELTAASRLFAAVGLLALLLAAVLVPLGMAVDRALLELSRSIESAGARTGQEPAAGGEDRGLGTHHASIATVLGLRHSALLSPVMRAVTRAVDQFHERERGLRNQLRDLEIRHRVSEAERRQVEAVLHSLRDAVIVTDPFNEIVMANRSAAEALGFDLDGAIHQPVTGVVADERLCRLIRDVREAAVFGDSRHVEHEICTNLPEGERICTVYDVMLACVENHKGEVAAVITILHDLTRERELSQMKTDFVSKASHELRTPLASIRAYVEMLVDGEAEGPGAEQTRQEFYRIIQDETERLGRLIDNMLNISRIEAGIVQIERENVDVKHLIARAVHSLEPSAREKQMTVNTKIAAVDLCVEGDPDMLYQVVLNLLSNSVKYTPEGGRVTISADSDNLTRSVLVSVADTGLGIPPDSLPKLFDKFYRVENYKRVAKGTGLGLSLCKHIVETVHHGQIGVESKLGMGSKFWFSVPMRYAGSQAAA